MWNAESSTSVVKRRGSPSEEPNPQRIEACADSSLISQLVNDKFIEGVACVLSVHDNIVGMAKKLLKGGKSKHGTLDLDAWQYFTSLNIWRNDKFSKVFTIPTMAGPKQKHLNQQIQETKARISDDPSSKPLFLEKQYIRVVLILVILFGRQDVSPPRPEKSLGGLDDDDDDDGIESLTSSAEEELEELLKEMLENPCCCNLALDDDRHHMISPCLSEKEIKKLADEVQKDAKFYQILLELLGTVQNVSPLGAVEHFDKVKEIWGNPRFIDLLLKIGYLPDQRSLAFVRLSKYIKSRIKEDLLFGLILEYDDPDFKMRVALSILIGFWSNQCFMLPLVCTMGGDALNVKKKKRKKSGVWKEERPRDWMSDTPTILEIYRDKSIGDLVDQLKEEPKAIELARVYLETLELGDCYCSYKAHAGKAAVFWSQPSVVLKFNEAMKKNPNLVKVLTKYSMGAETLRLQERMSHIRKDVQRELKLISPGDSDSKMRLGLNLLFGYWNDRDVTQLFRTLCNLQTRNVKVYLSGNEIVAFYYYARCDTDVEGLKSWLANKYGQGSHKALLLAKKIGDYQKRKCKEAKLRGYREGPLSIEVVLNGISIFDWSLYWFDSSIYTSRVEQALHYRL